MHIHFREYSALLLSSLEYTYNLQLNAKQSPDSSVLIPVHRCDSSGVVVLFPPLELATFCRSSLRLLFVCFSCGLALAFG